MTRHDVTNAMRTLGLTVPQFAKMLGISTTHYYRLIAHPDNQYCANVTDGTKRLINAYLAGYRPEDWPV